MRADNDGVRGPERVRYVFRGLWGPLVGLDTSHECTVQMCPRWSGTVMKKGIWMVSGWLFPVISGFCKGVLVSWTVPDKFTPNFGGRQIGTFCKLEPVS